MTDKKKDKKKIKNAEETKPELTEEEALAQLQDAIDNMPVKDLAYNMMMNMASTAYKKLGLPVETNAKYKDLKQAKLAIDCLDGLLNAAAGDLEPQDIDAFRQTAANLKMTFAQLG